MEIVIPSTCGNQIRNKTNQQRSYSVRYWCIMYDVSNYRTRVWCVPTMSIGWKVYLLSPTPTWKRNNTIRLFAEGRNPLAKMYFSRFHLSHRSGVVWVRDEVSGKSSVAKDPDVTSVIPHLVKIISSTLTKIMSPDDWSLYHTGLRHQVCSNSCERSSA